MGRLRGGGGDGEPGGGGGGAAGLVEVSGASDAVDASIWPTDAGARGTEEVTCVWDLVLLRAPLMPPLMPPLMAAAEGRTSGGSEASAAVR